MRKRLINFALALFSLTLGLAAAEVALRFAKLTRDNYVVLFRTDSDFKFHYRANQRLTTLFGERISIDRFGHRATSDYEQAKPAGVHRILILGDSVGFGLHVDDADVFTFGIAEQLSQRLGRAVEIINGSCESYNTFNELAWYRKEGRAYEPDEVWLLYVSNDVDTSPNDFYISPEGYSTSNPDSLLPLGLRVQLRRSALALLAHSAVTNALANSTSETTSDIPDSARAAAMQPLIELSREVMARASLRIFYLPRRVEVESGHRSPVYDWVAETAQGVDLIDLTKPLRELHERGDSPYLRGDSVHLSGLGHAVLRQTLLAAQPQLNEADVQ